MLLTLSLYTVFIGSLFSFNMGIKTSVIRISFALCTRNYRLQTGLFFVDEGDATDGKYRRRFRGSDDSPVLFSSFCNVYSLWLSLLLSRRQILDVPYHYESEWPIIVFRRVAYSPLWSRCSSLFSFAIHETRFAFVQPEQYGYLCSTCGKYIMHAYLNVNIRKKMLQRRHQKEV